MPYFVFSTLTNGQTFRQYQPVRNAKGVEPLNTVNMVTIYGGANCVNPITAVTPEGTVTSVSDEDYLWLKEDPIFKRFVEDGWIKAEEYKQKKHRSEKAREAAEQDAIDRAVKNMASRDNSAPIRHDDYSKKPNKEDMGDLNIDKVSVGGEVD